MASAAAGGAAGGRAAGEMGARERLFRFTGHDESMAEIPSGSSASSEAAGSSLGGAWAG